MKLIVGLGNPGRKYIGTRHNVGFEVIASLATRYDIGRPKSKFNAEIAETRIANEKAILVSPLTYMNLSGKTVIEAVNFYKLEIHDLIVICDDLALDVGRIRIKPAGSAGGQNGLKDVIARLGRNDFARMRIGIGSPPDGWDAADYVLGKFSPDDRATIESTIHRAADAVETWVSEGVQNAMNRFNADPAANKTQINKQNPLDNSSTG